MVGDEKNTCRRPRTDVQAKTQICPDDTTLEEILMMKDIELELKIEKEIEVETLKDKLEGGNTSVCKTCR
jgi:hypothetical protein